MEKEPKLTEQKFAFTIKKNVQQHKINTKKLKRAYSQRKDKRGDK